MKILDSKLGGLRINGALLALILALGGGAMLSGCGDDQGTAEEAGEQLDEAVEEASEELDEAVEESGDAIEDAADEIEDSTDGN